MNSAEKKKHRDEKRVPNWEKNAEWERWSRDLLIYTCERITVLGTRKWQCARCF